MPALTYSGIIVGIMIVHTIVIDIMGLSFSTYNQIAGIVIPLVGIAYAIYGYRKEYRDDVINYQKALGFGVLVSFFIALVISVFSAIYTYFINPDLLEIGQQMAEEKMIQRGMSPEVIERAMESRERFNKPVWTILFGTLSLTLFGTIFSLIAAAFLKKEPKDPFAGVEE